MKRPMEQALQVAQKNLKEIRTVTEWAEEMGYENPKTFSRKFRNYFGRRPKSKLIKIRVDEFVKLSKRNPNVGCYVIALNLGFKDEIALSKFIKRHTGASPNNWRKNLIK